MKKILFLIFLWASFKGNSQTLFAVSNNADSSWSVGQANSPTNLYPNRKDWVWVKNNGNTGSMVIRTNTIKLDSFVSRDDSSPSSVMWLDGSGFVKKSSMSTFATASGFITQTQADTRYIQWSDTIPNEIMTKSAANEAIAEISSEFANYYTKTESDGRYLQSYTETDPVWNAQKASYLTIASAAATYQPIGTYATASNTMTFTNKSGNVSQWTNDAGYLTSLSGAVLTSRTITINGTTQDLSANRTWNVGDVNTSGSYSNPAWITSLAWSKITGTPTTFGGYGISPTINNSVSRSISNAAGSTNRYTVSATQPALVNYSITMTFSITALLGSSATAYLEYSTNSGSTWTTVSQVTTTFNLGLTLSGSNDLSLSGWLPPNALVRIRPATTNATISYITGQEILY